MILFGEMVVLGVMAVLIGSGMAVVADAAQEWRKSAVRRVR